MPDPGPILSRRAASLKPSATLAIAAKAKALTRQGVQVLNFSLGEPDFDTPAPIREAAIKAINAGQTRYMPTLGDPETRSCIADKLTRENAIPGLTADHVAISTGAKHSFYLVAQCLLDTLPASIPAPTSTRDTLPPPNEVLLPVPAWVSYRPIAELAGGVIIELPTTPGRDFKITPDQLRAAITPRSRMLVLNSPSNPCGTMYTPDELKALARVVSEAAVHTAPQLVIVTDEIYEKIIFGSIPHYSIGATPEVAERTVTINGLSKAFAMTGWRVGYAAAAGDFGLRLIKAIDALQGQMTSCITSFVFPAIRAALKDCAGETEQFRAAFARRSALIYDLARAIPGFDCPMPTGAFYIFPDISRLFGLRTPRGTLIQSADDFASALLAESHVAVVPGEEFGGCGRNHIRISYACSEEQIERGMKQLAAFVSSLK